MVGAERYGVSVKALAEVLGRRQSHGELVDQQGSAKRSGRRASSSRSTTLTAASLGSRNFAIVYLARIRIRICTDPYRLITAFFRERSLHLVSSSSSVPSRWRHHRYRCRSDNESMSHRRSRQRPWPFLPRS